MSFGSDSPGGSPEGIGGNESGIGGDSGGGDGGGSSYGGWGDDYGFGTPTSSLSNAAQGAFGDIGDFGLDSSFDAGAESFGGFSDPDEGRGFWGGIGTAVSTAIADNWTSIATGLAMAVNPALGLAVGLALSDDMLGDLSKVATKMASSVNPALGVGVGISLTALGKKYGGTKVSLTGKYGTTTAPAPASPSLSYGSLAGSTLDSALGVGGEGGGEGDTYSPGVIKLGEYGIDYAQAKADQLNLISGGGTKWTGADVAAMLQATGMTAEEHFAAFGMAEGIGGTKAEQLAAAQKKATAVGGASASAPIRALKEVVAEDLAWASEISSSAKAVETAATKAGEAITPAATGWRSSGLALSNIF